MHIQAFKLEEFFAKHEFNVKHLLCASDCEPLMMREVLSLADIEIDALWHNLRLGYTDSKGHPFLRAEIRKLYKTEILTDDDVLVVIPEEGVFLTMMAILERGDRIIAPFPAYQSLYEIAVSFGCEIIRWLPEVKDGRWLFDVEYLCDLMRKSKPKMVVLNFPHNPTGALLTQNEWMYIMTLAVRTGTTIFSDEMYRFLEHDEADRVLSAGEICDNAISLCGMSKSFALPGLRIGWLTSRSTTILKRMQQLKDYTTICSSAPSEILALMALQAKEKILTRNRGIVLRNKNLAQVFFNKHSELFSWIEPRGGSVAFMKYHGGEGVEKFCENLLYKKSVLLAPASMFGAGDICFRIGFGREGMQAGLDGIEEYLQEI